MTNTIEHTLLVSYEHITILCEINSNILSSSHDCLRDVQNQGQILAISESS